MDIKNKLNYSINVLSSLKHNNSYLFIDELSLYNSLYMNSNSEFKAMHYKNCFMNTKKNYLLYIKYSNIVKNAKFDLLNINKYQIKPKQKPREYKKDTNKYSLIKNNQKIIDINLISYLKTLYKVHKISKAQYKESIKRLNKNKHLRENVLCKLNLLMKSNKAKPIRNNISGLARQNSKTIHWNYKGYSINIQKKFLHIKKNCKISLKTLDYEFNLKLKNSLIVTSNKLFSQKE